MAVFAWVFYAATVVSGLTQKSLPLAAEVANWVWQPMSGQPVTWLITLPFRILPEGIIPSALNLFSALLAAMTLGVLARSVELLPWDCRPNAKPIWQNRFPAIFSALALGLSFNFWQEGTAMTGELTGLLLLACSIWLLLEFRVSPKPVWLLVSALTWGVGMAENWAMILALPLYLGAVVWVLGPRILEKKLIVQMACAIPAGFAVVLLPPLWNGINPNSPWNFSHGWLMAVQPWKMIFITLRYSFFSGNHSLAIAVILFFTVPIAACLLRIRNESLPNQPNLDRFQIWIFRAMRVGLLLVSFWILLDPVVGPRELIRQKTGVSLPLLTLDYLTAIGLAYVVGSLLFVAQTAPKFMPFNPFEKMAERLRRLTPWLLLLSAIGATAVLLNRNAPQIWRNKHLTLQNYGATIVRSLPKGGGMVLADDYETITLVRAALGHYRADNPWQTVCLPFLTDGKYRGQLEKIAPGGWLAAGAGDLKVNEVLQLLGNLAKNQRIYFVQPHAGVYLFELFQPQPLGAVSELKLRRLNELQSLTVSNSTIDSGEQFWEQEWNRQLGKLATPADAKRPQKATRSNLAILPPRSEDQHQLAKWYSATINDWGVVLQKENKFANAQTRFQQALALNPDNFSAAANLYVCSNLMAGKTIPFANPARLAEKIQTLQQLAGLISQNGEPEDPMLRCVIGNACLAAGWPRQAWQEFDRASKLSPESVAPQLSLAKIYARTERPAELAGTLTALRSKVDGSPSGRMLDFEIALLEARTYLVQTNREAVSRILTALLTKYPNDSNIASEVFCALVLSGNSVDALDLVKAELAKNPNDPEALNNQAAVFIQLQRYPEAVAILDHAVTITNAPAILLNRALAQMKLKNFTAAERDYSAIENSPFNPFAVQFGLAQVALQKADTQTAIKRLEAAQKATTRDSSQWLMVQTELEKLRPVSGGKN